MRISEARHFGARLGRLTLLGPAVLLAACVSLGGGDGSAPREVQVTADAVTITGPRGFCVDPTSTRNEGDTGFVLLGNCAAISGRARAQQPDIPAVLTAAVGARSDGGGALTANLGELDGLFRSDAGRGLLSRSGDPASVTILETRVAGDMFLLHARDTSAGALGGVAQDYWRAYMDVGPRLATLSVLALADQEVSDQDALLTLTAFADAVQSANSGNAAGANAADLPQAEAQGGGGLFQGGLFQRIFR
ncbi:hypothetical protein [Gymnodinialimonas hymeniacidonis]|uniref:hypothetical protein n=1 Tax=Gymnodinialimonas hymeniacidonis TaxID=3126508 RepID=UPI0034C6B941